MKKQENQKDGTLYFRQRDIIRPVSTIALVASILVAWFTYSWVMYILAGIIAPVALVMFFVSGSRLISDNDLQETIDHACLDYDKPITDMANYERVVLRQPAPVETSAFSFGEDAAYFKKGKNNTPRSDRYARAHFFFTNDALLVIGRRLSLTELTPDGAGVSEFSEAYAYAGITAELQEHTTQIHMTAGGKSATVKWFELVITEKSGEELLRLPVQNDMDVTGLCDELIRKTAR